MKFTDKLAQYIVDQQLDLDHLTIILPSERAKKYIAASLYRAFGKPVLAPEMLTIDRWVKGLSDKTVIDRTRALIRLFNIQLIDPPGDKDRSFDEFMSWGNILLSDFDEIDRYLLETKTVFTNLKAVRELENWEVDKWSFEAPKLTEGQKRFLEFWEKLPDYYTRLNEDLTKDGVCYPGKAYRELAEQIDRVFKLDPKRQFIFAGFNALSAAEMSLMKQLHKLGRAHILIDADAYYLKNDAHEAGRFLRRFMNELDVKELPFVSDDMSTAVKKIEIIECPQITGQVKAAATILNHIPASEMSETLVLLADESLIAPLVKNLPKHIGKANITLGLPLRNSALRTWVDLIFSIQENKARFKTKSIYFQDLQRFWNHPFTVAILDEQEKQTIIGLELQIIERNTIFLNPDKLITGSTSAAILPLLTTDWNGDWLKGLKTIRQMNQSLFKNMGSEDAFEKAVVEAFDRALQELENILSEGIPDMSIKSFRHLFQQHWNTKSIAYHGNPLQGLQIMGLLETRLLEFKNIVILGMNEGNMPPTNPIQTLIPMDLRKYFQLPVPRDKQGLFAHHFYRLLHSAENIWVTYTSAQESVGSNEASRYLLQLELELSRLNPNITLERKFYAVPNTGSTTEVNSIIPKTPEILARMGELFERSISASALNKYLKCPLDYYYRYVMDFGEESVVEEEVETNTFGTFIHNVLEALFTPFARHDKDGNKVNPQPSNLTPSDIDGMLNNYAALIHVEFLKHFDQDPSAFSSGKNLLSYEMALELTKRILQNEKEFLVKQTAPVFIEYLELELTATVDLMIQGRQMPIKMKGFVDRIDSVGGRIRIIDYKSGKTKTDDVTIKSPEPDLSNLISVMTGAKHNLQLVMYSYLYKDRFGSYPDEVSIYSLVNLHQGLFPLQGNLTIEESAQLFPEFLRQVVDDMFDPEIPFEHMPGQFVSFCKYCE
jgi:RecB family exonuclease